MVASSNRSSAPATTSGVADVEMNVNESEPQVSSVHDVEMSGSEQSDLQAIRLGKRRAENIDDPNPKKPRSNDTLPWYATPSGNTLAQVCMGGLRLYLAYLYPLQTLVRWVAWAKQTQPGYEPSNGTLNMLSQTLSQNEIYSSVQNVQHNIAVAGRLEEGQRNTSKALTVCYFLYIYHGECLFDGRSRIRPSRRCLLLLRD